MKNTFVIISVSDRVNELNCLIESIIRLKKMRDIGINVLYQDYMENRSQFKYEDICNGFYVYPQRLGCHGARVALLRKIVDRYDNFINLDDDMILTEYTDYARPLEKAQEKGTGFVLTNWARTEELMRKKVPAMEDKFIKQAMVYQGGGMVYRQEIARLMAGLKACDALFDDIWPLTTYINGYENYRYLGSLAIHSVCTKGGMNDYMKMKRPPTLCDEYINYRLCKDGREVHIPMDSDLTEKAKEMHRINKKG